MENCNQHGNCNFPRSICEKICTAYINLSSEAEVIRVRIPVIVSTHSGVVFPPVPV